jgi:serine/threonine-protein kinase
VGIILYEMVTGKQPFTGASPMDVMNDRLLNHPMPPSLANDAVSPQLQEVIYRALERDPKNRYARAHDFAHDLQHLDQVGVEDRPEIHNWRKRKSQLTRKILYFSALALIPVVILLLMVLVAHRR